MVHPGHEEFFHFLLGLGADSLYRSRDCHAITFIGVIKSSLPFLKLRIEAIKNAGSVIDNTGDDGANLLWAAVRAGNSSMAEYLIKLGASPIAIGLQFAEDLLDFASAYETACCKVILDFLRSSMGGAVFRNLL